MQLKDFIERKKFNPEIDQNYFAKSRRSTVTGVDDILSKDTANVFVALYFLGNALILIIIIILLIIYLYKKRWDRNLDKLSDTTKNNIRRQSKIFGAAGTGLILNTYILCLDASAVSTWDIDNELENKLAPVLIIALVFTSLSFLWCSICFFLLSCISWFTGCILQMECGQHCCNGRSCWQCCCNHCRRCCNKYGHCYCGICCIKFQGQGFIFLTLSTLGPTFSLISHLPFITIAFLNDAYHASSVFIFYMIVGFILFGALQLSHSTCPRARYDNLQVDEICIMKNRVQLTWGNSDENRGSIETDEIHLVIDPSNFNFLHLETPATSVNIREVKIQVQNSEPDTLDQIDTLRDAKDAVQLKFNLPPSTKNKIRCKLMFLSERCDEMESNRYTQAEIMPENPKVSRANEAIGENEAAPAVKGTIRHIDPQSRTISISFEKLSFSITKGILKRQPLHCIPELNKSRVGIRVLFFLIPSFILLILTLIALVTYVLIQVPINQAFSDASNRLIGFYQTALILIGAYLLYKKFYIDKKKPSIQNAVKDRVTHIPSKLAQDDATWKHLSKDERVKAFYSRVVDLVATYEHNNQQQPVAAENQHVAENP